MLKINKDEMINDSMIEGVFTYGSSCLKIKAKEAGLEDKYRAISGRYGLNTMFLLTDGFLVTATLKPDTYMERIPGYKEEFLSIDYNRFFLRKSLIREIVKKPNSAQRRQIKEAKAEKRYFNLCGANAAKYYLFLTTGRIYGVRSIVLEENL